jgi:hypothetical protein
MLYEILDVEIHVGYYDEQSLLKQLGLVNNALNAQ